MRQSLAALALAAALTACSPRTIALRQTAGLLSRGAPALYEEPDPQLARESLGAQLGLVSALLRNEPDNPDLLALAAEGFGGYAFLFLEDSDAERAKGLYLRGRDYSLRLLSRRKALAGLASDDLPSARQSLSAARREDVPGLFWAAFGWGGFINLSKDSPEALADLPRVLEIMSRARELDPDYHFAGADLFFGLYYASRPALLGGDIKKAQAAFQQARRRTGGKYLMDYVIEARYAAVGLQDQELFKSLLQKALSAPPGQLAGARLTDEVAKQKAAKLLERIDDFF